MGREPPARSLVLQKPKHQWLHQCYGKEMLCKMIFIMTQLQNIKIFYLAHLSFLWRYLTHSSVVLVQKSRKRTSFDLCRSVFPFCLWKMYGCQTWRSQPGRSQAWVPGCTWTLRSLGLHVWSPQPSRLSFTVPSSLKSPSPALGTETSSLGAGCSQHAAWGLLVPMSCPWRDHVAPAWCALSYDYYVDPASEGKGACVSHRSSMMTSRSDNNPWRDTAGFITPFNLKGWEVYGC